MLHPLTLARSLSRVDTDEGLAAEIVLTKSCCACIVDIVAKCFSMRIQP